MTQEEKQKIREEFISKFTVWNDRYRYATLAGKEEYPTPDAIADYWLQILDKAIKDKLEAVANEIELKRRKHYNEQQPFLKHRNDYNDAYSQIIIDVLEIINKHK